MRAIIIGGSNGIGLAIAKELIDEGYSIDVLDKNPPEEGVLNNESYTYQELDLLDLDEDLVSSYVENKSVNLLMITAGFGRIASFEFFHTQEIKNMIMVNTIATIQIIRLFYKI